MGTRPYVVRPGDFLTSIAHASGVDPDVLWNDGANAALRAKRQHAELLAPGDVLYIPIVPRKFLSASVGATNSYTATLPTVAVHVFLNDSDGYPLAGKPVTTEPVLGPKPLTTDGAGGLLLQVPLRVPLVRAIIDDPPLTFDIHVGHLDPHDVSTGAVSRLRQLGYVADERWLAGRARWYLETIDPTDVSIRAGTSAFQAEKQAPVTGELDDTTAIKLRDQYGC